MPFALNERVEGKYLATSAGVRAGTWRGGTIASANADGTYNILYDDGCKENAVLERYVREAAGGAAKAGAKRAAPDVPEDRAAALSRRAGKARALPPAPAPAPIDVDKFTPAPAIDVDEFFAAVEEDDDVAIVDEQMPQQPAQEEEDDVAIVDAPAKPMAEDEGGGSADAADEDEVQMVGRSGDLALVDFPHVRVQRHTRSPIPAHLGAPRAAHSAALTACCRPASSA